MKKPKSKSHLFFKSVISLVILSFVFFSVFSLLADNVWAFGGLDSTADAAGLPKDVVIAKIIGQIIYAILSFLGVIFIILLIYGGFLRMTAQGEPTKIKTSYGIITSAVVGVIIILASYTLSLSLT